MADFDPDAYLAEQVEAPEADTASVFDPDAYLSDDSVPMGGELGLSEVIEEEMLAENPEIPVEELPEVSQGEALGRGALQGATFGFSDEMGGKVQSGLDKMQGLLHDYTGLVGPSPTQVSEELAAEGFTGDIGPTSGEELYEEAVAQDRTMNKAAEEQHGGTYLAGELAGSLAIPVPGASAAKVASKIPKAAKLMKKFKDANKIKKGIATGAGMGALEAAGRTEADLTSAEGMEDTLKGAAAGGIFGGVLGKVASKIDEKSAKKLLDKADKLEDEASQAIARSMGATPSQMKSIMGSKTGKKKIMEKISSVGKTLQDEGIFKVKQTAEDLNDVIFRKMDEVGQNLEKAGKKIDDKIKDMPIETFADDFNAVGQKLDDDLESIASNRLKTATDEGKSQYQDLSSIKEVVKDEILAAAQSQNKLSDLVQLKRQIQREVDWRDTAKTATNEYYATVQSHLTDLINSIAKKGDNEAAEQILANNKKYSDLVIAENLSGNKMLKEALESGGIGWKDYFLGGIVGGMTGRAELGVAAVGAKKSIEKASGKKAMEAIEAVEGVTKYKRAQNLKEKVANKREALFEGADKAVVPGVTVGSAFMDKQEAKKPHLKHQKMAKIIERATPEMLTEQAETIRTRYEKAGEPLARILDRMTQKDKAGRRADMFHILQQPQYRKMLGLIEE